MKTFITALGLGTLATAIIGGIVVAVSLLDHKVNKDKPKEEHIDISKEVSEKPSNQPVVSEKVQYLGWEDVNEEFFEDKVVEDGAYKACYCTVYSDDYMTLFIPTNKDNDEFDEIYIEPWKARDQEYIPYEYTMVDGYYLNHKTGEAWSVKVVNYEFLGGYISSRKGAAQ